MTQTALNRTVARATGEAVATIARRGFGLVDFDLRPDEADLPPPQMVDWDELDQQRGWQFPRPRRRRMAAVA